MATASKASVRNERIGNAVVRAATPVWFVFTIFAGGLIVAMLSGYVLAFISLPKPWTAHRVTQIAWVIGALGGAYGVLFGRLRPRFATLHNATAPQTEQAVEQVPPPVDRSLGYAVRTAGGSGIIFAFLGFVLGGFLMMMWFSVTLSPFAPTEWLQSVRSGGGGVRTSNPMVAMLWLGPIVVLGGLGFFFGLIGAPLGWVTDGSPKQFRRSIGMKAIKTPSDG